MDVFGLHIRDEIRIDQAFVDALPTSPASGGRALVLIGRRVVLLGAVIRGFRNVFVVGDEVVGEGPAGKPSLAMEVPGTPAQGEEGLSGRQLVIHARRLTGVSATSTGQRGGKGATGDPGPPVNDPNVSRTTALPPLPPPPPPPIGGHPGLRGHPGSPGGAGGPVHVFYVEASGTNTFAGVGGPGGAGGDGGPGGPGIPNEPENQGPQGPPGEPGGQGGARAAEVLARTPQQYDEELRPQLSGRGGDRWAEQRGRQAWYEFRSGNLVEAEREYAAAEQLRPGSMAPQLRALMADHRTEIGVERDLELDLVPAVDFYAGQWRAAADTLRAALFAPGDGPVLLAGDQPRLLRAREAVRTQLTALLGDQGPLEETIGESGRRRRAAAEQAQQASGQLIGQSVLRIQERLGDLTAAEALISYGSGSVSGSDLVTTIAQVLGVPDPTQPQGAAGLLLPADTTLLVDAGTAAGGPYLAGRPTTTELAAAGVGLDTHGQWAQIGTPGSGRVVHLRRVAADLRAAQADGPLRDLLIEMTEACHSWRLATLRLRQIAGTTAAIADLKRRAREAIGDLDSVDTDDRPAKSAVSRLLRGLLCLFDALDLWSQRAQRALKLYILDRGNPGGISGQTAALAYPDLDLDLDEKVTPDFPVGAYDLMMNAIFTRDPVAERDRHRDKGRPLVVQDGTQVIHNAFSVGAHTAAINRFVNAKSLWFDLPLAKLPPGLAEMKVVGVTVNLRGMAGNDNSLPMTITHAGFSQQRDLDLGVHDLTGPPATQELVLRFEPATQVWTGDTAAVAGKEHLFSLYGRGLTGGWTLAYDSVTVPFTGLQQVDVNIQYEAMESLDSVSLKRVEHARTGLFVGARATGRVLLTGPAPAGGKRVTLHSSRPDLVKVLSGVDVIAGASTADFPIDVLAPTGPQPIDISASMAGVRREAIVHVPPPVPAAPLVTTVPLGGPGAVAAVAVSRDGAGGRVFATHSPHDRPDDDGTLSSWDLALTQARTATVGHGPRALTVHPQGNHGFVVNGGHHDFAVQRFEVTAGMPQPGISRPIGLGVVDVALDPAAQRLYVVHQGGAPPVGVDMHVRVLAPTDLSDLDAVGDEDGFAGIIAAAVDSTAARVYVARTYRAGVPQTAAISVITRRADGRHAITGTIDLQDVLLQPVDVAVDVPAGLIFVSCLGGNTTHPSVVVLDQGDFPTDGGTRPVPAGAVLPVPGGGRAVATRPGTGIGYVATSAGLLMVDGRSRALRVAVKLGDAPCSVAVDPVTGVAYVGDFVAGTLSRVLTPADVAPRAWR
ncbi:hypothetical protein [Micromonospora sp. 050-3]|uniref:hypothetical protein n=1 Tax=Micromonospora sp. 050-3 TaxID=2789265 RepID=UPI00397D8235